MKSTLYFILTLLSGGIFLPYWLVLISTEINNIDNNLFPDCRKTMKRLPIYYGVFFIVYFSLFIMVNSAPNNFVIVILPLLFLGLFITSLYFWSIFKIANKLRSIEVRLPNNVFLLFLSIYLLTPLIFQVKLNRFSVSKT